MTKWRDVYAKFNVEEKRKFLDNFATEMYDLEKEAEDKYAEVAFEKTELDNILMELEGLAYIQCEADKQAKKGQNNAEARKTKVSQLQHESAKYKNQLAKVSSLQAEHNDIKLKIKFIERKFNGFKLTFKFAQTLIEVLGKAE